MAELGAQGHNHHIHLLATKSLLDGHIHVHGDLQNKDAMCELIQVSEQEIGIEASNKSEFKIKEVVFKNRQRIGDMLVFTCGVRDFKKAFPDVRINVISTAGHIWDHNPNVDRTLLPTPENTIEIGPGKLTNKSNSLDWHFANAFRVSIEEKLGISIPQGESRPDIYLTQEEWDSPRLIEKPYWIISTSGEKGWGCKMYPFSQWQKVIDQNPDLTFVQIGTAEDNAPRLQGANVVDYIGKTQSRETGIRDLFKLFLHAEGSIGLVSFHMHLSGGLHKPCIVIAGAREPVSFTQYPGHRYLATDGCLPCALTACWHCNIDACTNLIIREETLEKKIPKCVDIINPEDITRAIRSYYAGGRLHVDKPSDKPKRFKNIVPTPPKPEPKPVEEQPKSTEQAERWGMKFGGGALTERDWEFILGTLKKHNVKSVLEFGTGLSTLLFQEAGVKTLTYETHAGWIDKVKKINPKCHIELWDGINIPRHMFFDFAFVDGPAGDKAREQSTAFASIFANVVLVHDAGREWARKYQEQYLVPDFDGPFKGGHRCHLWVRKANSKGIAPSKSDVEQEKASEGVVSRIKIQDGVCELSSKTSNIVAPSANRKSIKIVSTARGWGGCARSVTTIMKFLIDAGHKVQFIPFRNAVSSKEFKDVLANDLKDVDVAYGYGPIKEACDVMLVYADDFVWEFKTNAVADIFSEINAEKKIMMLNYRRGEVGKIPWTKGWDQYLFLCSAQEQELLKVYPEVQGKTKVLPPCTILEPFLKTNPDYENGIRIVRHNSQGDTKFINANFTKEQCIAEIDAVVNCRPDLTVSMLPGPSFYTGKMTKVMRTGSPEDIARFLATGNLFWYSLPNGYMDMGPRVILEAMAVGLPVMADSWSGGAVDRVASGCGFISDYKDWIPFIKDLDAKKLSTMGKLAKDWARTNFTPEKWMEVILK